mgnify:CR=1 FL=1
MTVGAYVYNVNNTADNPWQMAILSSAYTYNKYYLKDGVWVFGGRKGYITIFTLLKNIARVHLY